MSEQPRAGALQVYQAKRQATEEALERSFVAFVRSFHSRGTEGPVGYLVYATDGDLGIFRNDNFVMCYTTPEGAHFKDVQTLLNVVQQETRRRYAEADFHATIALTALSSYTRMILEDWREPVALAVCAVSFDCGGKARSLDYTGRLEEVSVQCRGERILLTGCYDAELRSKALKLLKATFQGRKPTKAGLRAMLAKLKGITKTRRVNYLPLNF